MFLKANGLKLGFSEDKRSIGSLELGRELITTKMPLFSIRLRDELGEMSYADITDADVKTVEHENSLELEYSLEELDVKVSVSGGEAINWKMSITNKGKKAVEYVDFPTVSLNGRLRRSGGDCAVISSYNEGLIVEDSSRKRYMTDPEYPSQGGYMMFPYMLSAQFMLFLSGKNGLYMGVHDKARAPKGLDFCCTEEETLFRVRLFMGGAFGESVETPELVWKAFEGAWQDGADIYKSWLAESFDIKPLSELDAPDWYKNDLPLVITYPVRGIHDMDKMEPNKLFPYVNALPYVDEFAKKTDSRIMALLMHWEGTAPWAPPFVFPPYGGIEGFNEFRNRLHERGDLLGVYCSGLGFTEQSNLISSYNQVDNIIFNGYDRGFCRAPDQSLPHSAICTGQRVGYDICPASEKGREALDRALTPLFESGVDYIQALDQNHGGGMYFCYAKDHGHAPVPGSWMTRASSELLSDWKKKCPNTLLGCESAAAEPYIDSLRLSDARYELCYRPGRPIPLYSYLYHRYLRNFMGNQVSCPLEYTTELLELRLAYSFLAGDLLTLVLNDDGEIMFHWGMRDFSRSPDREEIIGFVSELQSWHKKLPELFKDAEMIKPLGCTTDEIVLEMRDGTPKGHESAVLSTAWKVGDKKIQLLANWTHEERVCRFADGRELTIPALSVESIEF